MAERFRAAWERLGISHDRFIRTTEDEHKAVVTAFLQRLWDRGEIYGAPTPAGTASTRSGTGRRRTWARTTPARTAAAPPRTWRRPTTSSG